MLKTILSISGKPGLYKMVSDGSKNMVIVESLQDRKKIPVYARDRIVSLGDISIYTNEDEVLLKEVLTLMKKKEEGKEASVSSKATANELRAYLGEVLPNYDKDRVHPSDIKKIIAWYNLLIKSDCKFEEEVDPEKDKEIKEN